MVDILEDDPHEDGIENPNIITVNPAIIQQYPVLRMHGGRCHRWIQDVVIHAYARGWTCVDIGSQYNEIGISFPNSDFMIVVGARAFISITPEIIDNSGNVNNQEEWTVARDPYANTFLRMRNINNVLNSGWSECDVPHLGYHRQRFNELLFTSLRPLYAELQRVATITTGASYEYLLSQPDDPNAVPVTEGDSDYEDEGDEIP